MKIKYKRSDIIVNTTDWNLVMKQLPGCLAGTFSIFAIGILLLLATRASDPLQYERLVFITGFFFALALFSILLELIRNSIASRRPGFLRFGDFLRGETAVTTGILQKVSGKIIEDSSGGRTAGRIRLVYLQLSIGIGGHTEQFFINGGHPCIRQQVKYGLFRDRALTSERYREGREHISEWFKDNHMSLQKEIELVYLPRSKYIMDFYFADKIVYIKSQRGKLIK